MYNSKTNIFSPYTSPQVKNQGAHEQFSMFTVPLIHRYSSQRYDVDTMTDANDPLQI